MKKRVLKYDGKEKELKNEQKILDKTQDEINQAQVKIDEARKTNKFYTKEETTKGE